MRFAAGAARDCQASVRKEADEFRNALVVGLDRGSDEPSARIVAPGGLEVAGSETGASNDAGATALFASLARIPLNFNWLDAPFAGGARAAVDVAMFARTELPVGAFSAKLDEAVAALFGLASSSTLRHVLKDGFTARGGDDAGADDVRGPALG